MVRAKYSDGRLRDVTRWVRYGSSDEGVASVDDSGHVKMNGSGEAAITLWYASRVLYARMGVPYANKVDPDVYTKFQRHNYIDDLVLAKLKALNIAPSGPAVDATFIRRAYLDAAGILPTSEEVEDFLADQSPDKRAKLIDRLLERDEFVDYWAYKWSDLMLISSRKLRANAMWSFYNWIRDSVKEDKPWNKFAYEIFTSSGDTRQNGALNYYVLHKDPIDLTETATEAFMGNRVTCARCHNHPLEKWTQKQYYELVNLFARVGLKNGNEPGDIVVYAKATGDVLHPKLLKPLPPTPLDGTPMSLDSTDDRRVHFADWLISPQNTYFARSLVNRVWANFMGRGLVESVDDVRATNPASNEELFAALSDDFVKSGYDVKRLIRTIMNSGVYQLSADSNAANQMDTKYYSRYFVKRLPAEVLLDAMSQVTGVPTKFGGYPVGTRALQLPDVQVQSQFLSAFGRPEADHLRRRGAVERAEYRAGAARDQRRHAEQEAERCEWLPGAGGEAGAFGFAHSGQSVSLGVQPLSDGSGETALAGRAAQGAHDDGLAGGAARSASPGAGRHDVGHADQQGISVQLLSSSRAATAGQRRPHRPA